MNTQIDQEVYDLLKQSINVSLLEKIHNILSNSQYQEINISSDIKINKSGEINLEYNVRSESPEPKKIDPMHENWFC